MKRNSLLRRRVGEAFMELQCFRDDAIKVMEAVRSTKSRELMETLVDEFLGRVPAHKDEVTHLLTVDGKVVPIDDKRRWEDVA